MTDIELYAKKLVNQLMQIKDRHRDILMADEINCLNNSANIILHNIKEIKNK